MMQVYYSGVDADIPVDKAIEMKRFVYTFTQENHFPRDATMLITVKHYPGYGWGRMYAVHCKLYDHHYISTDGLNKNLVAAAKEALKRMLSRMAVYERPIEGL